MKSEIIERLGQFDLLLPSLITEGLAANDRVKVRLSVLQAAAHRAPEPKSARFDLTGECRAAGIDAVALETLVNRASITVGERISAPSLGSLGTAIWDDVATMIRAVKAGDRAQGDKAAERLAAIQASVSFGSSDDVELAKIARLTGLSDGDGDSLHRLVMDLHKALNRLGAAHAEEVLAGAHVYALLPEDRPAVEAFMRGVAATEKLKFGHPGLATTATRAGGRLTIQNDIGETDAHVVVIAVDPDAVTITYTDVHLARAKFFTGLFRNFPVQWSGLERKSATGLGDDGAFYLVTGRYPFESGIGRDTFLETIGASLVFLIDWNKARKILREWVSKTDAVRVLNWAALHRVGHRGFLELGGGELVASAVRHATPTRIGFGERLDQALGRDAAVDFIKTVLRVSTEALLQGSSVRLARDRIEAALVGHLQRVDRTLLAVMIRQAGLAREIAAGIARFVAERQAHRPFDCAALAERARRIEEKADRIAIEARSEIARFDAGRGIERLVNQIENTIDELEQAAFVASLVPPEAAPELLEPLAELCAATVSGTEAAAIGIAATAEVPDGHRVDTEDALAAVGRLIDAEHRADATERTVTARLLTGEFNLKTTLSVLELARALERSTDRLAGFGHLLREHVLADLSA
ncbi:MAG: hypothetical protein ABSD08_05950 [Xanthobacteraceae bacterium]|jgi:uncharacterized protein Yka (UPF0111/DUF47 family)